MDLEDYAPNVTNFMAQFISSRGNEYFCEIDEEYITDRFNLTGLNTEVHYYQHALDLITDVFDLDCEDDMRETIEKSARHLYGLVHARYIVTTRGLAKMVEKFKKSDFGRCPRVMCESHPLLPFGPSDNPGLKTVKLYCAKCEDIYNPKSSRHASIDGAYFGSSFHNILFQVYPALVPVKSRRRYEPKIFGFKVHHAAALGRWQDAVRRAQRKRLEEAGLVAEGQQLFAEDAESSDAAAEDRLEEVEDEQTEAGAAITMGAEAEGVDLQAGGANTLPAGGVTTH
jgi:casein kinase II subunit beta